MCTGSSTPAQELACRTLLLAHSCMPWTVPSGPAGSGGHFRYNDGAVSSGWSLQASISDKAAQYGLPMSQLEARTANGHLASVALAAL